MINDKELDRIRDDLIKKLEVGSALTTIQKNNMIKFDIQLYMDETIDFLVNSLQKCIGPLLFLPNQYQLSDNHTQHPYVIAGSFDEDTPLDGEYYIATPDLSLVVVCNFEYILLLCDAVVYPLIMGCRFRYATDQITLDHVDILDGVSRGDISSVVEIQELVRDTRLLQYYQDAVEEEDVPVHQFKDILRKITHLQIEYADKFNVAVNLLGKKSLTLEQSNAIDELSFYYFKNLDKMKLLFDELLESKLHPWSVNDTTSLRIIYFKNILIFQFLFTDVFVA